MYRRSRRRSSRSPSASGKPRTPPCRVSPSPCGATTTHGHSQPAHYDDTNVQTHKTTKTHMKMSVLDSEQHWSVEPVAYLRRYLDVSFQTRRNENTIGAILIKNTDDSFRCQPVRRGAVHNNVIICCTE